MTATATAHAPNQTNTWLNIHSIKVVDGFNHRKTFDDEELQNLADSIKDLGVLQPLLVTGDNHLVAGERRLRAAKMAGLQRVPVMIVKGMTMQGATLASLTENLVRADVAPVEQAEAFAELMKQEQFDTQEKLAAKLKISVGTVASRLQLINVSEIAKQGFNTGSIPLKLATFFESLSSMSPEIADATARAFTGDQQGKKKREFSADQVLANPRELMRYVAEHAKFYKVTMLPLETEWHWGIREYASKKQAKRHDELQERYNKLPGYGYVANPRLTTADTDAVRAFGSLVEITTNDRTLDAWSTDKEIWSDRVDLCLDDYERRIEESRVDRAKKTGKDGKKASDRTDAEKEARAKQLAAEREKQRKAYSSNTRLGAEVRALSEDRAISVELARIVADKALNAYDWSSSLGAAVAACFDDWHTSVTNEKTAKTKHTFPEKREAGLKLTKWVLEGKTAEQILNRLGKAMYLNQKANDLCVPNKSKWADRWHRSDGPTTKFLQAFMPKKDTKPKVKSK